jgi:hypothetical protein
MPEEAIVAYRARTRVWTSHLDSLKVDGKRCLSLDERRGLNEAAITERWPELSRRQILARFPRLVV